MNITRRTLLRSSLAALGAVAVQPALDAFAIEKPKRYWRGVDLPKGAQPTTGWYEPRNQSFDLCGVDVGGEGGAKWEGWTSTTETPFRIGALPTRQTITVTRPATLRGGKLVFDNGSTVDVFMLPGAAINFVEGERVIVERDFDSFAF